MWTPDLTLYEKTNELTHLEQQPTRCDNFVENPEEQVHWLLTRRGCGARCDISQEIVDFLEIFSDADVRFQAVARWASAESILSGF